ncbi:unnamed protein product [Clavelina lepadiformis]|uniref:Uncharacterized protein n=1 Tax=Clavelina lepadiformis TaxID=159417 RepID=A0ABP0F401_CLALP
MGRGCGKIIGEILYSRRFAVASEDDLVETTIQKFESTLNQISSINTIFYTQLSENMEYHCSRLSLLYLPVLYLVIQEIQKVTTQGLMAETTRGFSDLSKLKVTEKCPSRYLSLRIRKPPQQKQLLRVLDNKVLEDAEQQLRSPYGRSNSTPEVIVVSWELIPDPIELD